MILNDYLVRLQYKTKVPTPLCTENVVIAAFTTANARLRLYESMEFLSRSGPGRLLYTDTDSLIFVKRLGQDNPPCGDYLGQLKDEYPSKKIVKYASAGPKSYFFMFEDKSHVTKVKGFTLNFKNSKLITPALIEDMVRRPDGRRIKVTNERKIARCRRYGVITQPQHKHFRVVYTKRVICGKGLTVPYGYRRVSSVRMHRKRKAGSVCGPYPGLRKRSRHE